MNAKHNLEFPDYIFTLFLYLIVDTITIISKEAHRMHNDFLKKCQQTHFATRIFLSSNFQRVIDDLRFIPEADSLIFSNCLVMNNSYGGILLTVFGLCFVFWIV